MYKKYEKPELIKHGKIEEITKTKNDPMGQDNINPDYASGV